MESTKEVSGNWSSGGETALTGLTPSTNYSISVAGVNQHGDVGVYSESIITQTDDKLQCEYSAFFFPSCNFNPFSSGTL